jgi:DNA replication protein DnaC
MKGRSLLTNVVMATLMELYEEDRKRVLDILMPELPIDEQEQLRAALRETAVWSTGVPKRFQECTFDNFSAYNPSTERARDRMRRTADLFPAPQDRGGFVLSGPSGVGKTHLATAFLTHCVRQTGASGRWASAVNVIYACRERSKTARGGVIDPLIKADLLVLDDLGAWDSFDEADEVMRVIVDARYDEKRTTVFTTNYPDVPDDTDPTSLLYRIGFHMRSRLFEMCEFLDIDGADYRELPANGNADDLVMLWKRRRTLPAQTKAAGSISDLEARLRTALAERDQARGQLQTIGRKAFWAAKPPSEQK